MKHSSPQFIRHSKRRHSEPPKRYRHSPGMFKREFSPRGTTIIIRKEFHPESEPITIKLSGDQLQRCKQSNQLKDDINDQQNQTICSK